MVETHLHLASGVGSILHQAILVLPCYVIASLWGSPGQPNILKVVGIKGSATLVGGSMRDQVALVTAISKSPPLN